MNKPIEPIARPIERTDADTKPTIETLREALRKLTAAAFARPGERVESFASIPARPDHDADLLLSAALSELESTRATNAALVEALEWVLDAPDVCTRCRRAGELCVGHAALASAREGK